MKIVVLTPVRNEEWILEKFLSVTSLFADHIIILDQKSTDNTKKIANRFPKVVYYLNENDEYDEEYRQIFLIEKARELVKGKMLLLALDADEIITHDSIESAEWKVLLGLDAGTRIFMRKYDLLPNSKNYVTSEVDFLLGYVDDGKPHEGKKFHSPRLPLSKIEYHCVNIIFMHLAIVRSKEYRARQRLYTVLENISNSDSLQLRYRKYSEIFQNLQILSHSKPVPDKWLQGFDDINIDFKKFTSSEINAYNQRVLESFREFGVTRFWYDDIWSVDYNSINDSLGWIVEGKIKPPPKIISLLMCVYKYLLYLAIQVSFKRK
jgi:hypothetical protein